MGFGIPIAVFSDGKTVRMPTVQLALTDAGYAQALRRLLAREAAFEDWDIESVSSPELSKSGVLVLDAQSLDHVPHPLPHPERVVLVTSNAPEQLTRAWEAGIVSVIFDHEPLSTAMLAILAARYRACRTLS